MLRALVEAGEKFASEGRLAPVGYKETDLNWVIQILPGGTAELQGRYKKRERRVTAPDRQRSSDVAPFLLVDQAKYVLGVADEGKAGTGAEPDAYLALLRRAAATTRNADLLRIVAFLEGGPGVDTSEVGPKDVELMGVEREDVLAPPVLIVVKIGSNSGRELVPQPQCSPVR